MATQIAAGKRNKFPRKNLIQPALPVLPLLSKKATAKSSQSATPEPTPIPPPQLDSLPKVEEAQQSPLIDNNDTETITVATDLVNGDKDSGSSGPLLNSECKALLTESTDDVYRQPRRAKGA
jgi:hypothetical protein